MSDKNQATTPPTILTRTLNEEAGDHKTGEGTAVPHSVSTREQDTVIACAVA